MTSLRVACCLALAGLFGLLPPAASASLHITFTDASDYSADEVYVWITAAPGYQLKISGESRNLLLGHSYRLSDLSAGLVADSLVSGRIYFSLGAPLPDPGRNADGTPLRDPGVLPGDDGYTVRHDFMELTDTGSTADVADLTSMDQFAIPLTLQLRRGGIALTGSGTAAGWKGHTDQQVLNALVARVNPAGSNVVLSSGQFVRVDGATKFPELYHNAPGDPHSMSAYLAAIAAAGRATTIHGQAFGKIYEYSAALDAGGNYVLTRTAAGDASTPETILVPASYKSGPNAADPVVTLPEAIYLSNPWYGVNGGAVGPTRNDLPGAVVRDLFAALNLGYIDSPHVLAAGETVDSSLLGRQVGALTTDQMRSLTIAFSQVNDYYNLYADSIRDLSDSYGYAYSDWNENLSKVSVLLNATHHGQTADELNIQIAGSRTLMVPEPEPVALAGLAFAIRAGFARRRNAPLSPRAQEPRAP